MATKLYLHRTEVSTPATLPAAEQSTLAADANLFTNEDGSENRRMDTTISAVAQTTLTNTSTGDTNPHNYYIARWVSDTLYQSKISANTWDFKTAMTASNAAANFPRNGAGALYVNCYVWRPSNQTKVGTILDGNTNADGEEAGTSSTLIECTFAGAEVSGITPGDAVLVFEMWAIVTQANTSTRTQTVSYDGTTESSTSNNASYIQTPENLRFTQTATNASIIAAGGNQASTANTTQFWSIAGSLNSVTTTENDVKIRFRQAGTLSNLVVRAHANTVAGATTITVRKNGSDTSLVATFTASVAGVYEDLTNTVSVAAGDDINLKSIPGAATNTFSLSSVNLTFTPTDATTMVHVLAAAGSTTISTASTTFFVVPNGVTGNSTTESNAKVRQRKIVTYSKLYVWVISNSRTTNTVFKSRKNGADGNLTVTYGSGEVGLKEDTSNSDVVAVGDDWNFGITTSTGTENLVYAVIKVEATSTDFVGLIVNGNAGGASVSANLTRNFPFGGGLNTFSTESDCQIRCRLSKITLSNLHVFVNSNGVTADSTMKLRINAVNSALSATLTNATTGLFSDTSNEVTAGSNDDLNWQCVTGATGTSLVIVSISCWVRTAMPIGFTKTLSESAISSGDTITTASVLSRTLSESSISVNETLDRSFGANRALNESSIASTDDVTRTIGYPREITEAAISVSDQLDRVLSLTRELAESAISVGDSVVRAVTNSRTLTEAAITVNDQLERMLEFFRELPESVSSGDTLNRSVTNSRTISEAGITVNDDLARIYNAFREINESSISSGDTLTTSQVLSRTLSEAAITVNDQLDRTIALFRSIPESVSVSDQLTRAVTNVRELIEGAITSNDTLERIYNAFRSLGDTVVVTDDVEQEVDTQGGDHFDRPIDEPAISVSDQLDRSVQNSRNLPESVSVSDQLNRALELFRSLPESVSVSDSVARSIAFFRELPESVASSDSVERLVGFFRNLPESVVSSDAVTRSMTMARNLADTVLSSDTVTRSVTVTRELMDSIVSGDTVERSISFFRQLLDSTLISDTVVRAFNGTRELIESISVSDLLERVLSVQENVTNTDLAIILTHWLEDNWTEDPVSTVEHYLIPPKNKITFGSRFDMTAGSHSDMHVHVRNVSKNPQFLDTADKIEENADIISIWAEVRYIPDTPPDFSGNDAGAPSDMMWQIRSYITELIRSNPEQLENLGIEVISIMQEIPDANTPADVHGQNVIENMYTIVIIVKCFYTLEITRVE